MNKDYGAHGAFDSRASSHSFQLWTTTHRNWFFAAAFLILIGAAAALVARDRS
jgi:hypothetical protein